MAKSRPDSSATEDAPGLREALRRPVIKRVKTLRWDPDTEEWVPESKEIEVGIGPVGAVLVGAVAFGAVAAVASGVSEAAKRRQAQKEAADGR